MRVGLQQLRVVHHCPMSWNEMAGGDRVRQCPHCARSVYNVADMTQSEAEALIANREGRPSAACFQRRDGTIVAKQCRPYSHAAVKVVGGLSGLAAVIALIVIPVLAMGDTITPQAKSDSLVEQNRAVSEKLRAERDPATRQELVQRREQIRERFRNNIERIQ